MDGRAQWHMHAPTSCTCCGHIADRLVARSVDEGIGSCWSRVVVASASCLVVCAVMANMRGRAEDGGDREIDGGFDRCSCLHEGFLQQLAYDKTANTKRSNGFNGCIAGRNGWLVTLGCCSSRKIARVG